MWVIWIFRIVPIKVPHSLRHHSTSLPEPDELRQLIFIHERHVIYVTEYLPIKDDRRWNTLVAHTLRIGLVIFAIIIHLVADVLNKSAILALCIWWVTFFTLFTLFGDPIIKALMLKDSFLRAGAVNAFLVWPMSAFRLRKFFLNSWFLSCIWFNLFRCVDHLLIFRPFLLLLLFFSFSLCLDKGCFFVLLHGL